MKKKHKVRFLDELKDCVNQSNRDEMELGGDHHVQGMGMTQQF